MNRSMTVVHADVLRTCGIYCTSVHPREMDASSVALLHISFSFLSWFLDRGDHSGAAWSPSGQQYLRVWALHQCISQNGGSGPEGLASRPDLPRQQFYSVKSAFTHKATVFVPEGSFSIISQHPQKHLPTQGGAQVVPQRCETPAYMVPIITFTEPHSPEHCLCSLTGPFLWNCSPKSKRSFCST